MPRAAALITTSKPANTTFTNAEKVIGEVTAPQTTSTNQVVTIEAGFQLVTVAEAVSVTLRIRRDSLTGAEVAKQVEKAGASAERPVGIQGIDSPGEQPPRVYVLTAIESAAKTDEAKEITMIAQC